MGEATATPLARLRANWDLALTGALAVAVAVAALAWSPLKSYSERFAASGARANVSVDCLSGSCWLRPQGTLNLYPIPPGRGVDALLGDEVMTMGAESSLLVNFKDEPGELRLANTGVIRISKGRKDVDMSDKAPAAPSFGGTEAAAESALVFIGEVPIKIVSPKAETPVIATAFPVSMHLAFVVEKHDPAVDAKMAEWSVVDITDLINPTVVDTVKVSHTEGAKGAAAFYGEFRVKKAGFYALVPVTLAVSEKNYKFKFEVKPGSALEGQIHGLLEGVTSDSNSQIEIRGQ